MTDCLDTLLKDMSSTFMSDGVVSAAGSSSDGSHPQAAGPPELQLNEDKTFKWRGLLKNQFAKKTKSEAVAAAGEDNENDNSTVQGQKVPDADNSSDVNGKCDDAEVPASTAEDLDNSKEAMDADEQSKHAGRRCGRGKFLRKSQNGEIGSNNAANTTNTATVPPPGKKRGRKRRPENDPSLDRSNAENTDGAESGAKLRRSERNSFVDVKSEIEEEAEDEKKTRRSVRLVNKDFGKDITAEADEKKITNIQDILGQSDPAANRRKLEDEKTPKKRGRRAKVATITPQEKLSIRAVEVVPIDSREKGVSAAGSSNSAPKRSRRRIKPTAKVLANDELRYEFETNNIVRITSCSDNLDDSEASTSKSSSHTGKSDAGESHPVGSNAVKKKLFSNAKYSPPPIPAARPCPDINDFLSEIRASKWHAGGRGSEEKKMNKKQLRKLAKQKEKFLERFHLQRSLKREHNDSDESLSENEEFVPNTRVQVGKPNVTLRQRMRKESTPTPQPKPIKRKTRVPTISQSQQSQRRVRKTLSEEAEARSELAAEPEPVVELICHCQQPSQYYTQITLDTSFCCAVDNIDDEKVGCCNELSGELLNLLRPSQSASYMILCEDHKKRLSAHNCCADCGVFCTQGNFVLCQHQHFFHPKCAQKYILNSPYDPANPAKYTSPTLVLKCPHCGVDTPEKTSMVTMKCQSVPVYLDSQKPVVANAAVKTPRQPPLQSTPAKSKLPKLISMEGLIPDSVMDIIYGDAGSEPMRRYSTRDMLSAIKDDLLEEAALIIASGYDVTRPIPESMHGNSLHAAASSGSVQMTYLLLCKERSEQFVNQLDRELKSPAFGAIMSDRCEILNLLLQNKAEMNFRGLDGMTCLHVAAKYGNLAAAEMIVDHFRNSKSNDEFLSLLNAQDDGGWTAMVWAAELGYAGIVTLLLNNGADPNICDNDNNTVIHWATLAKHSSDILHILLAHGSNCNVQNIEGDTPLHIACRQSKTRVCLQLIAKGADLMVKNQSEDLPYDCIPNEQSSCARIVGFNMQMKSFGPSGLQNKLICGDISNGRELRPIQVMRSEEMERPRSAEDEDYVDLTILPDFKYITKPLLVQNNIKIDYSSSQMRICNCSEGSCTADQCSCIIASAQNWYTAEGRLSHVFNYEDPPVIYECTEICGCNKLKCKNRVVQNGIKLPLQVFECPERAKGWGVRSLRTIPRGAFVAEYIGEILTEMEANNRTDDSYFFELGEDRYCIDAMYYGNVSRFFNHSCTPNITAVRVFFEHHDFRFPKIAFFASRDIPVGDEICFDYGRSFWDAKKPLLDCKCLSQYCRYTNKMQPSSNHSSSKILTEIIEV